MGAQPWLEVQTHAQFPVAIAAMDSGWSSGMKDSCRKWPADIQ